MIIIFITTVIMSHRPSFEPGYCSRICIPTPILTPSFPTCSGIAKTCLWLQYLFSTRLVSTSTLKDDFLRCGASCLRFSGPSPASVPQIKRREFRIMGGCCPRGRFVRGGGYWNAAGGHGQDARHDEKVRNGAVNCAPMGACRE